MADKEVDEESSLGPSDTQFNRQVMISAKGEAMSLFGKDDFSKLPIEIQALINKNPKSFIELIDGKNDAEAKRILNEKVGITQQILKKQEPTPPKDEHLNPYPIPAPRQPASVKTIIPKDTPEPVKEGHNLLDTLPIISAPKPAGNKDSEVLSLLDITEKQRGAIVKNLGEDKGDYFSARSTKNTQRQIEILRAHMPEGLQRAESASPDPLPAPAEPKPASPQPGPDTEEALFRESLKIVAGKPLPEGTNVKLGNETMQGIDIRRAQKVKSEVEALGGNHTIVTQENCEIVQTFLHDLPPKEIKNPGDINKKIQEAIGEDFLGKINFDKLELEDKIHHALIQSGIRIKDVKYFISTPQYTEIAMRVLNTSESPNEEVVTDAIYQKIREHELRTMGHDLSTLEDKEKRVQALRGNIILKEGLGEDLAERITVKSIDFISDYIQRELPAAIRDVEEGARKIKKFYDDPGSFNHNLQQTKKGIRENLLRAALAAYEAQKSEPEDSNKLTEESLGSQETRGDELAKEYEEDKYLDSLSEKDKNAIGLQLELRTALKADVNFVDNILRDPTKSDRTMQYFIDLDYSKNLNDKEILEGLKTHLTKEDIKDRIRPNVRAALSNVEQREELAALLSNREKNPNKRGLALGLTNTLEDGDSEKAISRTSPRDIANTDCALYIEAVHELMPTLTSQEEYIPLKKATKQLNMGSETSFLKIFGEAIEVSELDEKYVVKKADLTDYLDTVENAHSSPEFSEQRALELKLKALIDSGPNIKKKSVTNGIFRTPTTVKKALEIFRRYV